MFVLAAVPGPGVFMTVSRALTSGMARTLPVIAGIVLGDVIFLLLALGGLAALEALLEPLFNAVALAAAAYLIAAGIRQWRADPARERPDVSPGRGFVSGLSVTLSNPKVMLFYLGFLPAFVDLAALKATEMLLLALVVSAVLGAVMLGYAFGASRARALFTDGRALGYLNRLGGSVLIAAALLVLFKAWGS